MTHLDVRAQAEERAGISGSVIDTAKIVRRQADASWKCALEFLAADVVAAQRRSQNKSPVVDSWTAVAVARVPAGARVRACRSGPGSSRRISAAAARVEGIASPARTGIRVLATP
jgi:hypothetical protein